MAISAQQQILFLKMQYNQEKMAMTSYNLARSGIAGEKSMVMKSFSDTMKPNVVLDAIGTHAAHISKQQKSSQSSKKDGLGNATISENNIVPEEQLFTLNSVSSDSVLMQQAFSSISARMTKIYSIGIS